MRRWVFTAERKKSIVKARKVHSAAVKIGMRALGKGRRSGG